MPFPTEQQIRDGNYRKWDENTAFDKECLKAVGLPEDFHPTDEEACRITIAALEDY